MHRIALTALLALAACSNPLATGRHLIDPPAPAGPVTNRLGTAELQDVSLPDYASSDEVPFQEQDGTVRSTPKQLWADKPGRAITVTLARAISEVSGATVIPEPWPLAEPPKRRIRVDVEKALAGRDGLFRLTGRYYVSDETGGTSQARGFAIVTPVTIPNTSGVAVAQSAALSQLARQIAVLGGPGTSIATTTPKNDPFALPPLFPLEPLPLDEPAS